MKAWKEGFWVTTDQNILVSVIIPCYNEEKTIAKVLQALSDQTFPIINLEVLIADGLSEDLTRKEIDQFCQMHPDLQVRVLDNTKKTIPSGVNLAIQAAVGAYIIRMDAHSEPNESYIQKTVELLEAGKADNVGGVWKIQPSARTWVAESIAAAASHPFGVGDAFYRFATTGRYVDTVPFGGIKKELIQKIGLFDETLLSNEDYEFNTRILAKGGKIWLDPEIQSNYYARENFKQLAAQYWRYGYWKFQMLKRYPDSLKLRQALPPVFVLSLLGLGLLSLFWLPARWLLGAELLLYFLVLLGGSMKEVLKRKRGFLLFGMPLAIFIMHTVWGSGFLFSVLTSFSRRTTTIHG
jgi:succinoglycan biosynthesis protein ExoA